MALARLTAHTTFDQTDGAGMLLDAMHDSYFKLDPCQTLMLAALLEAPSMGEAIARLAEEIEAEDSELYQTLVHFYLQLAAQGLVRTAVELADAGIAYDALGGTKDVASVAEGGVSLVRPSSQNPVWERSSDPPWEFFLTGSVEPPAMPRISLGRRLSAACHAIRILLLFRFSDLIQEVPSVQLYLTHTSLTL